MPWPPGDITYIGKTTGRPPHRKFGIKQKDRLSHMYIIGKTGTGKSTLIKNMILQDIKAGRGCCLIDPHGDLVEEVVARIPYWRKDELVYIDATSFRAEVGYNLFKSVSEDKRGLVASGILEVFKKLWSDSWGVRMEHILRNAIFTLLEIPNSNLSDITRLFSDDEYRKKCIKEITNLQVKSFWQDEYDTWSPSFKKNAIAPIQNKIGAYLTDKRLRNIVVNPKKDISLREIMDGGKVLLVNLAKGQIGSDTSHLLGGMIVTGLGLAAFSRQNISEAKRKPFFIYMDEFQNFTTLFLADMLSELRKYKCGLTLSHQYLSQIETSIHGSIIGNVGSLLSFRLGAKDAPVLAKEFAPIFIPEDLYKLSNYHMVMRLMIGSNICCAFSGKSFEEL